MKKIYIVVSSYLLIYINFLQLFSLLAKKKQTIRPFKNTETQLQDEFIKDDKKLEKTNIKNRPCIAGKDEMLFVSGSENTLDNGIYNLKCDGESSYYYSKKGILYWNKKTERWQRFNNSSTIGKPESLLNINIDDVDIDSGQSFECIKGNNILDISNCRKWRKLPIKYNNEGIPLEQIIPIRFNNENLCEIPGIAGNENKYGFELGMCAGQDLDLSPLTSFSEDTETNYLLYAGIITIILLILFVYLKKK